MSVTNGSSSVPFFWAAWSSRPARAATMNATGTAMMTPSGFLWWEAGFGAGFGAGGFGAGVGDGDGVGDNADSEGNLIHLILNDLKVRILSDLENLF